MNVDEAAKAVNTLSGSTKALTKVPMMFLITGVFIGVQYVEFKARLQRIEDKVTKVEQLEVRIAALERK